MGKLYKVEFEDFGWDQVLNQFDGYIDEIETKIKRAKKESFSLLAERGATIWTQLKHIAERYRDEIKRQLTEQGWKPSEHLK